MNTIYDGNPEDYDSLIQNGYPFSTSEFIRRGWEILNKDLGTFVLYSFLSTGILAVLGSIPFAGFFVDVVIYPILIAGYYIAAQKISRGESIRLSDFFEASNDLVYLVIAALIMKFLIGFGFMLLVIPGVYLAVAYALVIPFIVLARLDFWSAMETSRKVVSKQWFSFLGLFFAAAGIMFLGILCLGVGIFVAFPLVMCTLYAAFEDIVLSQSDNARHSHVEDKDDDNDEGISTSQADPLTGDF